MIKRPRPVLGVSLEGAILITDQQRLIERHKGNTKAQPNPRLFKVRRVSCGVHIQVLQNCFKGDPWTLLSAHIASQKVNF